MLTPVDVQNKVFKGGIGYDKKEVEAFMAELSSDYNELYRSNVELKDKVATLDESLLHYRSIEDSVQKSLTISEKAAEETINAANDKARKINTEAEKKAEAILSDAREELASLQNEIDRLKQEYILFKSQYKKILSAQLQLCDGEVIDIDLGPDFESSSLNSSSSSRGGSYANESNFGSGLGSGLGGGGGYAGSNSFEEREKSAQEPSASVGSLNIDPFADAQNGGGRFSSSQVKSGQAKSSSGSSKLSLNTKEEQTKNVKVKRSIPNATATPKVDEAAIKEANKKAAKEAKDAAKEAKDAAKEAAKEASQALKNEKKQQAEKLRQEKEEAALKAAQEQAAESARLAEEQKRAAEAAARAAAQKAALDAAQAKARAEEHAKNEALAQEKFDKDLQDSVKAIKEAVENQGKPDAKKQEAPTYQNPKPDFKKMMEEAKAEEKVEEASAAATETSEDTFSGEVESKVDESTMLDSEDNYDTGFDFIAEDEEDDTFSGEVESKVNESNMLDSEDNHMDGFNFVFEEDENETIASAYSGTDFSDDDDDDVFSGEVESKVNESNMLDSEDNYSDGFDFVVGNEEEEEIPVINSSFNIGGGISFGASDSSEEETPAGGLGLDLNFGSSSVGNDEVLSGDIETKNVKKSNLIGNGDDEDEGFNFL